MKDSEIPLVMWVGPTCNHLYPFKWQVEGDFFCTEGKEKAVAPQSKDRMLPQAQKCWKQEEANNGFSPSGIRGHSALVTTSFQPRDTDFRLLTSRPLREYIAEVLSSSVVFLTAAPGNYICQPGYPSSAVCSHSNDCFVVLCFPDACIISVIKELIAK